jgi:GT2 family glycosyltransferase/SAM-dependent methyltransferase
VRLTAPEPAAKTPAVDVAIVNWNTPESACEAASAFMASAGATVRVVVIDNDSRPTERAKLEKLLPDGAQLILSDTNLGFGAGANRALRHGTSEFICVSNADVIPDPDAIAALALFCSDRPDCGMVGPSFIHDSAYHAELPTPAALVVRPLIGGFGHRPVPSPKQGKSIEVEQPAGACFMVRRKVWEQIGGFDEGYFLWYEDVDLARRLRLAGMRNYVCGDAWVRHREGLATGTLSDADHQAARLGGLRRYLSKHHPKASAFAAPLFLVAYRLRARNAHAKRLGFAAVRAKAIYILKAVGRRLVWAPSDLLQRIRSRGKTIPPRGLSFVGRSDFEETGREFFEHFTKLGQLAPNDRVLDAGCGIGRMAIPLVDYLDGGSYEGFDVGRKMIRWCTRNVSSQHSNFNFSWVPIYNQKYNPFGTVAASDFRFPYADDSFDFAFATSLFTHLTQNEVRHYLQELSRVLRPGASCLLTFFLITPESEKEILEGTAALRFRYPIEGGLTIDSRQPEEAVAFQEEQVRAMLDEVGLNVREPIHHGNWAHAPDAPSLQDIVVAQLIDDRSS